MNHYCNPMNLDYKYQVWASKQFGSGEKKIYREAADPSLILFKDKYYLFPSMTDGFLTSEDLYQWEYHHFLNDMPIYDYAPDVCVVGEYIYFSASRRGEPCSFYRTKDPETEPFEEIKGTFEFWDPDLFCDDDGRLYFYWGCSNQEPIYGVELDPETMHPLTEPKVMFDSDAEKNGYERTGDNHIPPLTEEEIAARVKVIVDMSLKEKKERGMEITEENYKEAEEIALSMFGNDPYIEGAWLTKYQGKYYLQYAIPGTQYNVYGDGVYVSDAPLGPYTLAKNNPYSYVPGGFVTGAGHGSTLLDKKGDYWHISTMRISVNYSMERRLGLWKAGFDKDGELYCDQRYADWPVDLDTPAFTKPDWMLLSFGKKVTCSSGTNQQAVTDENIRTWWRASSNSDKEWLLVDLGREYDVRAVQLNFADTGIEESKIKNMEMKHASYEERYIDKIHQVTRWKLEGSIDGRDFFLVEDKTNVDTNLPHDLLLREEGLKVQYLRLSAIEMPYGMPPCVSGVRVFGKGDGELPEKVEKFQAEFHGELDVKLTWQDKGATGYNILWGYAPDKLYHSCIVYGKTSWNIGALIAGEPVYARIDAFNDSGITEGNVSLLT